MTNRSFNQCDVVLSGCSRDLSMRNAIISFRLRRTKSPHGWSLFDHTSLSFHGEPGFMCGYHISQCIEHRRASPKIHNITRAFAAWAITACGLAVPMKYAISFFFFSFHSIWFMSVDQKYVVCFAVLSFVVARHLRRSFIQVRWNKMRRRRRPILPETIFSYKIV